MEVYFVSTLPYQAPLDSVSGDIFFLLYAWAKSPSDIQATRLLENDRPYAGFLYGGLALHSKADTILDTLEIVSLKTGSRGKPSAP